MSNEKLNFREFTHKQALNMGLNALEIVRDRQLRRIGIRITIEEKLVFQYLMDGKNEDNYLKGKEKVVKVTQQTSMYVYEHQNEYLELLQDASFCVSGGAIPIIICDKIKGSISISGMTQELDHALAQEVLINAYHQTFAKY